ncbi:SseB family protein [Streptomyces sp. NPDC048255]|uniref:SseB family protein n=1 Tax=Streptomyces sp. NPDC048255 TaxID=3154713 RepID=UPI0033F05863
MITFMTRTGETSGGPDPHPGRPLRLSDLADPADGAEVPAVPGAAAEVSGEGREAAARREFAVLLGEFRRAAVLVPLDLYGSLWTAEQGGIRWICAFSDEEALARFARAQGDAEREWEYRTVFGARLLDVMVPMLGVPAGVALDAGGEDGMLFPPVAGVVPESAVVGLGGAQ